MAQWLNSAFFNFDRVAFLSMHNLAVNQGGFFTPFLSFITFFGNGGWFPLVVGVILLLFKKTRKVGFTILLSVGIGALFTNLLIKNAVARARPYIESSEYNEWWQFVWGKTESDLSFPSGHMTCTMAFSTAIFLTCDKKISWLAFVFAILMGLSRVYLIVHYLTDVICGGIVGLIGGILGYLLCQLIISLIKKNKENKFCVFLLEFDLIEIFLKKEK